jgi:hypothetical protein
LTHVIAFGIITQLPKLYGTHKRMDYLTVNPLRQKGKGKMKEE